MHTVARKPGISEYASPLKATSPASSGPYERVRGASGQLCLEADSNASTGRSASAGAARVQKQANNFSATAEDGSAPWTGRVKWDRLDKLRKLSSRERQRLCHTQAATDTVRVLSDGKDARYGGVRTCGSRLCPVCGPRIATANGQAIEQCIRQWREAEGGRVLFGTFTVRHSKTDRFDCLAEGVSAGWHAVTSGRGWLRDRRRAGVVHFIRVFEEKYSMQNGWHLHVHYLLFIKRHAPEFEVDMLLDSMFARWSRAVVGLGLRSPLPQGQDLHEVFGDGAESLGMYFSKQVSEAEGQMMDADYRRLGFELTAKDGKTRRAGMTGVSLTPGEVLDLALLGDEFFLFLWREYEQGMNGRRVISWSKDLRRWAGVGMESDEELAQIAADEERPATVCEIEMRPSAFAKVVKLGLRTEVLRRVVSDGADAVVTWLDGFGVRATTGRLGVEYLDEVDRSYAHVPRKRVRVPVIVRGEYVDTWRDAPDYEGVLPF